MNLVWEGQGTDLFVRLYEHDPYCLYFSLARRTVGGAMFSWVIGAWHGGVFIDGPDGWPNWFVTMGPYQFGSESFFANAEETWETLLTCPEAILAEIVL